MQMTVKRRGSVGAEERKELSAQYKSGRVYILNLGVVLGISYWGLKGWCSARAPLDRSSCCASFALNVRARVTRFILACTGMFLGPLLVCLLQILYVSVGDYFSQLPVAVGGAAGDAENANGGNKSKKGTQKEKNKRK